MSTRTQPPNITHEMSEPSRPWERQPAETAKAFEAFCVFRDMGANRSVVRAAEVVGKTRQALCKWQVRHRWSERVQQFDRYNDNLRVASRQTSIVEVEKKQAKKLELTQAKVLEEMAKIAFAELKNAASWDASGKMQLKDSDTLDENTSPAIQEVAMTYNKQGLPQPRIKMHAKSMALQKLGEHFKLWSGDAGAQQQPWMLVFINAVNQGALKIDLEAARARHPIAWEDAADEDAVGE